MDKVDVTNRLVFLGRLPPGWLDGDHGEALDLQGLMWLTRALHSARSHGLPSPFLYPTPEARVMAEWGRKVPDPVSITAEIDLVARSASLVAVHHHSGAEQGQSVSLDDELGIQEFARFVLRYMGVANTSPT
ncbi:hypothetical protein L6R52_10835 [Myxococcota bacterium]|nr:hypothetical protein [Myxococcota bacterium]